MLAPLYLSSIGSARNRVGVVRGARDSRFGRDFYDATGVDGRASERVKERCQHTNDRCDRRDHRHLTTLCVGGNSAGSGVWQQSA